MPIVAPHHSRQSARDESRRVDAVLFFEIPANRIQKKLSSSPILIQRLYDAGIVKTTRDSSSPPLFLWFSATISLSKRLANSSTQPCRTA